MNDVVRPLLRTKKTVGGKVCGRPVRASASVDPDIRVKWTPRKKTYAWAAATVDLIRARLTKRHGDTISERAQWYLEHSGDFPNKADRTQRAHAAVSRWLRDPTRSAPPTAKSLAAAERKRASSLG